MFEDKAGTTQKNQALSRFSPSRVGISHKYKTRLERLSNDKDSSL
jgi:hypothetical protein